MEDTFIKTYRKILKWEWADDPNMMALWFRLLLEANYQPKKWHGITVERGQLILSLSSLSARSGISTRTLRTCLERLVEGEQITKQTTNKFTIITICNYDSYQSNNIDERQTNDKQPTNERQTTDKQPTTTKERKERKESKEENNISPLFVPPTVDDVIAYCQERNNGVDAVRFVSYYESVGWKVGKNKMKDWKAAVRTWERKDGESAQQQTAGQIDIDPFYKPNKDELFEDWKKRVRGAVTPEQFGIMVRMLWN